MSHVWFPPCCRPLVAMSITITSTRPTSRSKVNGTTSIAPWISTARPLTFCSPRSATKRPRSLSQEGDPPPRRAGEDHHRRECGQ